MTGTGIPLKLIRFAVGAPYRLWGNIPDIQQVVEIVETKR